MICPDCGEEMGTVHYCVKRTFTPAEFIPKETVTFHGPIFKTLEASTLERVEKLLEEILIVLKNRLK